MYKKNYITLENLEVYKLARQLSKFAWEIYEDLSWQDKRVIGNQSIESTDSVGANIAEGYSRYHYLDRIKFYYNTRGSLAESSEHWLELLYERKKVKEEKYPQFKKVAKQLEIKLNNFIKTTYISKNKEK